MLLRRADAKAAVAGVSLSFLSVGIPPRGRTSEFNYNIKRER
jgi:hypothetical protein